MAHYKANFKTMPASMEEMKMQKLPDCQTMNLHVELSADMKEVEFYAGGYFVCSTEITNLSDEAHFELFDTRRIQAEVK